MNPTKDDARSATNRGVAWQTPNRAGVGAWAGHARAARAIPKRVRTTTTTAASTAIVWEA